MYKYGKISRDKLNTCHPDLVKIFELTLQRSNIDIGISEGYRPIDRQHELFLQGKSKIDGITKKGKHNFTPSMATDFYIYHPDINTRRKLVYDKIHLAYVGGILESVAQELYEKGEIEYIIRWGANWDSDGVIDYDQSFDDYPHAELVKP